MVERDTKGYLLSAEGKTMLLEEYVKKKRSTYELAEGLGTYANLIRRALLAHGIKLRTKQAAQKAALKTGRHAHPTEGTHRPPATKERISTSVSRNWQGLGEEERARRAKMSKDQWEAMTEDEKERLRKMAAQGLRQAALHGSKLEKFLLIYLKASGYEVGWHREFLISSEEMHVDLYMPALKIAIEVDGPSHHYPIWGEEHLAKNIAADNRKTGLLLQSGLVVIRVKHLVKTLSDRMKREAAESLVAVIREIAERFPPRDERVIELEVT